jgi:hypothetical protein
MCQNDFGELNRWLVVNNDVFYNFRQYSSQNSTRTGKFKSINPLKEGSDSTHYRLSKSLESNCGQLHIKGQFCLCITHSFFLGSDSMVPTHYFSPNCLSPPHPPNSLLNYPDNIRCTQVNVMILGHNDCRQIKRWNVISKQYYCYNCVTYCLSKHIQRQS